MNLRFYVVSAISCYAHTVKGATVCVGAHGLVRLQWLHELVKSEKYTIALAGYTHERVGLNVHVDM